MLEKSLKLNMKNEITTLKTGSFPKRLLAFLMDSALAAFIMFGFVALVFNPIAIKKMHYSEKQASLYSYQIGSKLRVMYDEIDGNEIIYDLADIGYVQDTVKDAPLTDFTGKEDSFYINRIKYYYLNYKTGVNVEYPANANPEDYKAPNYNEKIDGKLPSEIYTEEWFNAKINSGMSIDNLISEAIVDLMSQEFYMSTAKQIKWIQIFIIIPPFLISFCSFFLVIPLVFKNGETLGKKTVHLAFVSSNGYAVQKKQIVFRQIILILLTGIVAFLIGRMGIGSIALLGVGVLIYYVATFINKKKQSPIDLLALTYLVDATKSVWFENANEEADSEAKLKEKLEEYRSRKVENKNVIQVGSTIIDEEAKREVEEAKKKNKKQ